MQIKARIRQSFGSASGSYDNVASLQKDAGKTLLQRVGRLEQYRTIADLGCGTGFLVDELVKRADCNAGQIVALDIAIPMLQTARRKLINNPQVSYLCADTEHLPLRAQSANLVLSNLAFQWCGDLGKAFCEIRRLLKPGGRFYFTIFGPSTLQELKSAWRTVDCYGHVNSFFGASELHELLQAAQFSRIELESRAVVSSYGSVWELMYELKYLGARTVVAGGAKHLTRKTAMQRMIGAYPKQNDSGMILATFEVITVSATVAAD